MNKKVRGRATLQGESHCYPFIFFKTNHMEAICLPAAERVYHKPLRKARRKRDEVFNIELTYSRRHYRFTVKTDYPFGPECMGCDYDIFEGRKHMYSLNHVKNEDGILCWEIIKKPAKGHDPELVLQIGKAISHFYGE